MIEEQITVTTLDGSADALLFLPDGNGPFPAILQMTDIGGIRPAATDMVRRLAAEGYAVLLPNVFYRSGRPPLFDFPRDFAEERTRVRFRELVDPLTPEAMERDARAYVAFLEAHPAVRPDRMGVVGYCFTGAMALRTAAARPDRIVAAASFHGGGLYTDAVSSPHLVLPQVKARLYFGHATGDSSMPAAAIDRLNVALEGWGGSYKSEIYEGASHGWTSSDGASFNQVAADRAFGELAKLFRETLR